MAEQNKIFPEEDLKQNLEASNLKIEVRKTTSAGSGHLTGDIKKVIKNIEQESID